MLVSAVIQAVVLICGPNDCSLHASERTFPSTVACEHWLSPALNNADYASALSNGFKVAASCITFKDYYRPYADNDRDRIVAGKIMNKTVATEQLKPERAKD